MKIINVIIICFVFIMLSTTQSIVSDEINEQSPIEVSNDIAILTLDDMIIPLGEKDYSLLTIDNVEDLIIAKCYITWNSLVITLDSFDDSTSSFDFVIYIDLPGYLSVTSYKFGMGIDGPVIVGNVSFVPSEGVNVGDWCVINVTPFILWNESIQKIPAVGINAIAQIKFISIDINQSHSE